jgi:hypothetical protein
LLILDGKNLKQVSMIRNQSSRKQDLIRSLMKNAEIMIQAGMSQGTRTCGKAACACHSDPSRRHGPHTYLTFRNAEDRSSGMYVSPEHLEEAVSAKQAWDEFWQTATKLATVNREEMKHRWQAGRKARATK